MKASILRLNNMVRVGILLCTIFLFILYRAMINDFLTAVVPNSSKQQQFPYAHEMELLLSANYSPESMTYPDGLESLPPVNVVPEYITSTIFMFRGDFSSNFYDLFSLQKRAIKVCDKNTTIKGCDMRLSNNYKWDTLSNKLIDTLGTLCNRTEKTDFYAKIDDDLIMSESKFDEIIRKMASTNCQVLGVMSLGYPFYWATGQIYIFKRGILDYACKKIPTFEINHSHEDILFGTLLNSTNRDLFCNLDTPYNHWHIDYEDRRVKIHYFQQHNE
ncbi:hypothetical protein TRVA0_109S00144 [Trichomonascus vanleenenianus]|uniref:uncharacterized protein n=1 Tax=Trichomonascus vanleenenianus TaxID=2268995 RepID=UPI003ECA7701